MLHKESYFKLSSQFSARYNAIWRPKLFTKLKGFIKILVSERLMLIFGTYVPIHDMIWFPRIFT